MAKDKAQDQSQENAEKASSIPETVTTGESAAEGRGKYLKMLAENKELAAKYGEADFQSLLNRIGSDGAFAQRFVIASLESHKDAQTTALPDAPQENNITGILDRTASPAVRVGGTDVPAVTA